MSVVDEALNVVKQAESDMERIRNLKESGGFSQSGVTKSLSSTDLSKLDIDEAEKLAKINNVIKAINAEFSTSVELRS